METKRSWVQIPQGAEGNGEGGWSFEAGVEVGVGVAVGDGVAVVVVVEVGGDELSLHHMMKLLKRVFRKNIEVLQKMLKGLKKILIKFVSSMKHFIENLKSLWNFQYEIESALENTNKKWKYF